LIELRLKKAEKKGTHTEESCEWTRERTAGVARGWDAKGNKGR
jgi:hypothetical protein